VSGSQSVSPTIVAQLCPDCGLCCNGVVFADVELQSADQPEVFAKLGVTLARKRRRLTLPQPCSCFDGRLCHIYADRPQRCRAFECGVLKRVDTGEMTAAEAGHLIQTVKAQAEMIRGLLARLGSTEEDLPLHRRYVRAVGQPIDLSGDPELSETRGKLMCAVAKLMKLLQKHFLR
jgi:hypothetical protein